ncbi:right-handed parallel beta-helix repeat-containing protein [Sorangium sp. So ce136]|uniref:right-handed parallel beta-helix repeat-containing protein n=1 Tax=Sorangium sp. So ce136 TaxID=3133284 RepID=UPI003F126850
MAAGLYEEDLVIRSRRVRLWGRCPALVEVAGAGAEVATLAILDGAASRSEVRALSITGPELGLLTTGASDVLVDHVRIHDTQSAGIQVEDSLGLTSVTVRSSLFEAAKEVAVVLIGSATTIETTVVRDTQPGSDGFEGFGIMIQTGAMLTLRRSLLEQNRKAGMYIVGADAMIEATVVRDTQPISDGRFGRGISIESDPDTHERANVTVRASLLSKNHEFGIFVSTSDAMIEATVVQGTQPSSDGSVGAGIKVEDDRAGRRATLALRASRLEHNHLSGVQIQGSDAVIEATVVRDSQPGSHGESGRGIAVQSVARRARATLALHASLLEHNHEIGVLVDGSIADIKATVVRGTQAGSDKARGDGISAQVGYNTKRRAQLTLRGSLLEQNQQTGVRVLGSDATIESTIVRDTQPSSDGGAIAGIAIQEYPAGERAKAELRAVLLSHNHWAGVLVAGSDATIEATVVRDTQPHADGTGGYGIAIQNQNERSNATLRTCTLEQNRNSGVIVAGSDATIEATVVRGTQPSGDERKGDGITVQGDPTNGRAQLTLRASFLEQNRYAGVRILGSDATIEATVVRDAQPPSGRADGSGIMSTYYTATAERAKMTLRSSLVEQTHGAGVLVAGSDAMIEATVVRDTQPSSDGAEGHGIVLEDERDSHERTTSTLRASIVEQSHDVGVLVLGSDATIEATVVRTTQPSSDGIRGHGIHIQGNFDADAQATATIRSVLVEQNHSFGVTVFDSDVTLDASVVRATQVGNDGTLGDGVAVRSFGLPATATITSTAVESNARAGISNFSAAVVLISSAVQCNGKFDLDGEKVEGRRYTFDGSKDNLCGCGAPVSPCPVVTSHLSPPDPISLRQPQP